MRFSPRPGPGTVVLSVDVADAVRGASVEALVESFARRSVPATFALGQAAGSPHFDRVLAGHPANEIALLVPSTWTNGDDRARVAAELTKQTAAAAAAGMRLSTLVATAGALDGHADLLLKHGVTAIRGGPSHATGPAWPRWLGGRTPQATESEPRSIRYGLWEFRPDVTLPAAGRGARRSIELASERGTTCQVSVDAAALAAEGRSGAAALDALLLAVGDRRAEGTLAVGTLADAARRLLRPRALEAAQSILRTRAA